MKVKKNDIGLKELFRQKLGDAEVMPSPSVKADLMQKLARREFLRFNTSSFNIYYLGIIITAAVVSGILLFSGTRSGDKPVSSSELILNEYKDGTAQPFSINAAEAFRKIAIDSGRINKVTEIAREEKTEGSKASAPENTEKRIVTSGLNEAFRQPVLNGNASDGKLIEKAEVEPVLFEPSVFSGCSPLKVHFENRYSSQAKFSWIFGDGGYSDQKSPDWIFDRDGEFRVVLNAYGSTGLISTYSVVIKVYAKPEARFEISPENAVIPDDEILFLNYSTTALSYSWDFGDGTTSEQFEPRHKYQKFGKYNVRLTINTEHGCSDTMVIADAFSGSGNFVRMPNAFIPNPLGPSGGSYSSKTDESAEIFHPVCSGVDEYQLHIFSKRGILIFESNDVNIGWDGYFKGELANPGVYVWKIRGSFSNGEQFTKMGDVTLLKN